MASYENNLRLKEITTGDEDGTWGTSTNTNLELVTDGFSYGTKQMAADANETFTMPDATADVTRGFYLKITSAVDLTATREITLGPDTVSKVWLIENATTGSQILTIKQGSGATVAVASGSKIMLVTDGLGAGAAVLNANPTTTSGTVTSVDIAVGSTGLTAIGGPITSTGNITLGGTLVVSHGGTGVTTKTGTGSVVLNNGPTIEAATITGSPTIEDATITDPDITGATLTDSTIGGEDVTTLAGTLSGGALQDYAEITNALGSISGTQDINLELGNSVTAAIAGATTFTFSNPAGGTSLSGFTLKLSNAASSVIWPTSVVWPDAGTAPTLSTNNKVDILVFSNFGGTRWYGMVAATGYTIEV